MDLLRHGGMDRLFAGIRAPSTLGTFLRAFTFGHVRQLDSIAAAFLTALATSAALLPGAEEVTYLDVDDTMAETHGYAKQGAGYGYTKVKGLNALLATLSTPLAAPVIGAARLRRGAVKSARGAGTLVAEALGTARACGAGGPDRRGWCSCAATRRSTATTSSPPPAAVGPGSRSPPGWTPRSRRRSPRSIPMPGRRSAIRRRSGTTTGSAGSPTPRSPRSASPRSPPAASPIT